MNITVNEIKSDLGQIYNKLMEGPSCASAMAIATEYIGQMSDEQFDSIGRDFFESAIRGMAEKVMKAHKLGGNGQLELPGLRGVDLTVTTRNGEGGMVVKRIEFATVDDLATDLAIHTENVEAARNAQRRAEGRNELLLPLMEQHGFVTAGQAIDLLVSL